MAKPDQGTLEGTNVPKIPKAYFSGNTEVTEKQHDAIELGDRYEAKVVIHAKKKGGQVEEHGPRPTVNFSVEKVTLGKKID